MLSDRYTETSMLKIYSKNNTWFYFSGVQVPEQNSYYLKFKYICLVKVRNDFSNRN